MSVKYHDLHSLISQDKNAENYFNSLPDYVREHMNTRTDSVNSFKSMQDYAENLLRGDN